MRVAVILMVLAWGGAEAATAQTLSFADARKAIAAEQGRLWREPDSIRNARISAPHPCPYLPDTTCVCVEADAKNPIGGYTGVSKTRLYFSGSKIVDSIGPLGDAESAQCGGFVPFPELNGRK
jgi:hypothetical protein